MSCHVSHHVPCRVPCHVICRMTLLTALRAPPLTDHNKENASTVHGYEGVGEFTSYLTYFDGVGLSVPISSIIALVDSSAECRQFISWQCKSSTINVLSPKGKMYRLTYWKNRKGKVMDYWGGASYSRHDSFGMVSGALAQQRCTTCSRACLKMS